jgi:hypothetical protein
MHCKNYLSILSMSWGVIFGLSACVTSSEHGMNTIEIQQQPVTTIPMAGGYQAVEAENFIEFCVDLDSQDDRQSAPDDPRYIAQYDKQTWEPLYDSREYVARDLVANYNNRNDRWFRLYHDTRVRWEKDMASHQPHMPPWTATALAQDPRYNGFGPSQTAWVLYRNKTIANPPTYAIAIRGTVFSSQPSAVEDVLFHPVLAHDFLTNDVSFASYKGASVHSGFAHSTFTLLLDDRYGILRALHEHLKPSLSANAGNFDEARIYIVGHSQGAAMATLVHAFLHYALAEATPTSDRFGLYGKHYALKSYEFAQPKPGNFYFSADFARYTQVNDNAIVINNDLDPVPQVPLTLQDLGDVDGYLRGASFWSRALKYVSGIGGGFRGAVGRAAEPFVKRADAGYGDFYGYAPDQKCDTDKTGSSWDFVPAGHVILLFGQPPAPADADDDFIQHHAWTYRNLIHAQLGAGDSTVRAP